MTSTRDLHRYVVELLPGERDAFERAVSRSGRSRRAYLRHVLADHLAQTQAAVVIEATTERLDAVLQSMQDDHAQQLDTFRQRSETVLQEFRNEAIERQRRLIEGLGAVIDGRAGTTTAPASTGSMKTLTDVLQLKINELAKTVATLERLPAVLEALKLKIDQRLDR